MEVTPAILDSFFIHLTQDSINFAQDSLLKDSEYIENQLKSELAGAIWGKNESTNIRLQFDNQVLEALKHFNEADAFIKSID
ncbi:hypothetical protein Ct9H90mP29_04440 [bacterium]|nr:MAG: hypothetical protein Ct9H90mP29_04440 [bacterium]